MSEQKVILISGKPGTGKTTIGRQIAEQLSIPFIGRDDVKELLFDELGTGDRAWSTKMGKTSFTLMYYVVEKLLAAGSSLVVETVFDKQYADPQWEKLLKKYSFKLCQIFCTTSDELRKERFIARNESGNRHPGHVDHLNYNAPSAPLEPLRCSHTLIELNTDDFESIDIGELIKSL
jgi:predicted kinase